MRTLEDMRDFEFLLFERKYSDEVLEQFRKILVDLKAKKIDGEIPRFTKMYAEHHEAVTGMIQAYLDATPVVPKVISKMIYHINGNLKLCNDVKEFLIKKGFG